jgi:hypothetical protein
LLLRDSLRHPALQIERIENKDNANRADGATNRAH